MLQKYKNSFWVGAKRVQYLVDLTKFIEYDEFTKTNSYAWQNEYRVALDLSNGQADQQAWVEDEHKTNMTDLCKIMFLNQGGKVDTNAKREPTILTIGDIRDICTTVTTNELINLQLPFDKLKANPSFLTPLEPPRRPVVTAYRPVMM